MRSKRGHAPLLFIPLSALMLLAFLTSAPLHGQEKKDTLTFRIMGYNVENLFDCRHDTLKNDCEFLPDAVRRWNYTKYKTTVCYATLPATPSCVRPATAM